MTRDLRSYRRRSRGSKVNIWLIFEKVDGALVHGVMETLYPRGDSGTAGVEQALDGYPCEVRTVHVQELDDWLKTNLLPPKARVLQRNGYRT